WASAATAPLRLVASRTRIRYFLPGSSGCAAWTTSRSDGTRRCFKSWRIFVVSTRAALVSRTAGRSGGGGGGAGGWGGAARARAGLDRDGDRVERLAPVDLAVVVLVLDRPHEIPPRRDVAQMEVAGGVCEGDVGDRVGERRGANHGPDQRALLDPLQRGPGERGMGQGSPGRKDHRRPFFHDVAPQIDDTREQLEVIDTIRFPPLGRLNVDRA